MQEDKPVYIKTPCASITRIKPKGKKGNAQTDSLKRAAELAADEIVRMFQDDMQFKRYVYQDKGTGASAETLLETENVKHLRETIAAIKELTDVMRTLNGNLSPEAESDREMQLKKLLLEERKILPPETEKSDTGVVILPEPEGVDA